MRKRTPISNRHSYRCQWTFKVCFSKYHVFLKKIITILIKLAFQLRLKRLHFIMIKTWKFMLDKVKIKIKSCIRNFYPFSKLRENLILFRREVESKYLLLLQIFSLITFSFIWYEKSPWACLWQPHFLLWYKQVYRSLGHLNTIRQSK